MSRRRLMMAQNIVTLDLINFGINNVALQAIRGMTWQEFADSEYNIEVYDGRKICKILGNAVQGWDVYGNTMYYNILGQTPSDVIVENKHYNAT